MKYWNFDFDFGAEKPFSALHVSDNHLLFCDRRDSYEKFHNTQKRYGEYVYTNVGRNMPYYLDALIYAKEHHLLLLHTGDMIDCVSKQNLEVAQKLLRLSGVDFIFCAGNHEYSNYPGLRPSTAEERAAGRKLVPQYFAVDPNCSARVANGINFVALYNGENQFTAEQTEFMASEIAKGLPVVLLVHTPIYCEAAAELELLENEGNGIALMGIPPEAAKRYPESKLAFGNPETERFLELLRRSPNVRLILSGHTHNHRCDLIPMWKDCQQLIAGGNYYGCGSILNFH